MSYQPDLFKLDSQSHSFLKFLILRLCKIYSVCVYVHMHALIHLCVFPIEVEKQAVKNSHSQLVGCLYILDCSKSLDFILVFILVVVSVLYVGERGFILFGLLA